MANQIKMDRSASIAELYERGWSKRRIARELGLNRETVSRHIVLRKTQEAASIQLPAGNIGGYCPEAAIPPVWLDGGGEAKPAIPPAGISGRLSRCREHHEFVRQGIESGLTARRYQDLRVEHDFAGAYDSVKRYMRRLTVGQAVRVERMECQPGEEARCHADLRQRLLDPWRKRDRGHQHFLLIAMSVD